MKPWWRPMRKLKLPDVVWLPMEATISPSETMLALGSSRQLIYRWRQFHDFPKAVQLDNHGSRGAIRTSELFQWLNARGVQVRLVG